MMPAKITTMDGRAANELVRSIPARLRGEARARRLPAGAGLLCRPLCVLRMGAFMTYGLLFMATIVAVNVFFGVQLNSALNFAMAAFAFVIALGVNK